MKTDGATYLPDVVGRGYGSYWRFEGRYRVVKGSRASKKSRTTGLNFIVRLIEHPAANLLVIRKTYRTIKDSCFSELKWAIARLGVAKLFKITESPLEMTYLPTGQKIFFRGLDDPLKITSITVNAGVLCWMWIEEAFELSSEAAFDSIDESIRGKTEAGLFKQITLTLNPWNERHWIKRRFFDAPKSDDVLAITTNFTMNEFLDEQDLRLFREMAERNPRRYRVAGLGEWGVTDGLVYEKVLEQRFDVDDPVFRSAHRELLPCFGLDFGYTNSPTALFAGYIDRPGRQLFVWDEMYKTGMQNDQMLESIRNMGYGQARIIADSEDPKTVDYLRMAGLRVSPAKKPRGSVLAGIQWLMDYEIVVHPRCVHFLMEVESYVWRVDKFGAALNEPDGSGADHLMDAMRYAVQPYMDAGTGISAGPRADMGVARSYWS